MLTNYKVKPGIQGKSSSNNSNFDRGTWKRVYLSAQLETILKGDDSRAMNEYRNKYNTQFIINVLAIAFPMICLFCITEYLTIQLNSPSFHWFAVLIALLTIFLIGGLFWIRFKRFKLISSWENLHETGDGAQANEKDIETVTLIQPGSSYQPLKIPSNFLLNQNNFANN
jgi:hypothetical protein